MPDASLPTGARLTEAFKMGQEPQDRLWAAIYVLIGVALLIGLVTVYYAEVNRGYLESHQEIDYENGSVSCLAVVDRDFRLPNYCSQPEVFAYYPPAVCEDFFADESTCGSKWRAT